MDVDMVIAKVTGIIGALHDRAAKPESTCLRLGSKQVAL